jgi:hypothetical protein
MQMTEFDKRRQLFVRGHNVTLAVVAMRVSNPDRSSTGLFIGSLVEKPFKFVRDRFALQAM